MSDADIEDLVARGETAKAIKLYQVLYRVDFKAARDAIEAMQNGPAPPADQPSAELRQLWKSDPVAAIRRYREVHPELGLAEVKTLFERGPRTEVNPLTHGQLKEVLSLLRERGWVWSIKRYREVRPVGLKEAKERVEELALGYNVKPVADSRCFIATAAEAADVEDWQRWRDIHLLSHRSGRWLTAVYYAASPPLARWVAKTPCRRAMARRLLRWLARMLPQRQP